MSSRIRTELVEINMGPQHPSTHGVLRLDVTLDGEVVVDCKPDVGYLHRGIEKLAEMRTWIQFIPITDRLDYLASMLGNAAYVGAIEKLGQLQALARALPGKDCGTCGAPTCAALAEDIVMGRATTDLCPYFVNEKEACS